jgi:protein-tyrosine phosphatase
MDQQNYKDVISQASSDEDRDKVSLILNALEPKSNAEVPDPYYGGKNGFEHVYNLLDQACNHIANQLQKDGNS